MSIYAAQDDNQFPALLAHYGNVGTSGGTSTPVKLAANPDTGALYVDLIGTESIVMEVGTINVGTIAISSGTITNSGTTTGVGTVAGIGVVTAITNGTIATNILPLGGVVLAGTVGVGTTASAIPATPLTSRKSLIVYNVGSTNIYLGGSGVTVLTGLPVGTADYSPSFDLGTTILYGIAGTSGGTVNVLEVS